MAASEAFHAAEIALELAGLVPKATGAILTQGEGDPHSAFGRMAAMAAIVAALGVSVGWGGGGGDFARSEEHTSELQSLMRISYAVFCLKKKTTIKQTTKLLH